MTEGYILDRVFEVNIERSVGVPDFKRFVIGYAKNPDREYFVIQGHPAQWSQPGKFAEFVKIVDFLVQQNARFVTPMELAAEIPRGPRSLFDHNTPQSPSIPKNFLSNPSLASDTQARLDTPQADLPPQAGIGVIGGSAPTSTLLRS